MPEWLFVLAMCCFFVYAAVSAHFTKKQLAPHPLPNIEILVTGAVVEEKKLVLPHGSRIVDALAQVTPLPDANVDILFYQAPLHHEQVVVVPKRGFISIYLRGAVVKEGVVTLPEGVRFPALIREHDLFSQDADLRFLNRKRRLLKDGECIDIPSKSTKGDY